jgi:hypothetical protein
MYLHLIYDWIWVLGVMTYTSTFYCYLLRIELLKLKLWIYCTGFKHWYCPLVSCWWGMVAWMGVHDTCEMALGISTGQRQGSL